MHQTEYCVHILQTVLLDKEAGFLRSTVSKIEKDKNATLRKEHDIARSLRLTVKETRGYRSLPRTQALLRAQRREPGTRCLRM